MKTAVFILAIGFLITASVSAQTKQDQKPDSIKIGYQLSQNVLNDSLILVNPFNEKNVQLPHSGISSQKRIRIWHKIIASKKRTPQTSKCP